MNKIPKMIKNTDNIAQLYEYSTDTNRVITGVALEGFNKQTIGLNPTESRQELVKILEDRIKALLFIVKELKDEDNQATNFITEVKLGSDVNENTVYS